MIEAAGYYAVNYANSWRLFGSSLLQKCGLWPANYRENADTVNPSCCCGIWQHWDKGRIDGISGDVDMDVSYLHYSAIIKNDGKRKDAKRQLGISQSAKSMR